MRTDLSPRSIATGIFRRKWAYAAFFWASVGLTGIYLALSPYKYESDATVMVNLNAPDIAAIPTKDGSYGQLNLTADFAKDIVESQISIITSPDVLRAALEKIGLDKVYPQIAQETPSWGTPMDAGIKQLGKDLSVIAPTNTMVLEVSLLNRNPTIAQATLQAILDAFFERQGQVTRNPRMGFVEQQLDTAHRELDQAEHAYFAYRQKQSISSLDEERSQLLKERTDFEESLDSARADLANATQRTTVLQAALTDTPASVLLSDEYDAPNNATTDDGPTPLQSAQKQYAKIMHASPRRRRTGVNVAYQNLIPLVAQSRAAIPAAQATVDLRTKELAEIAQRLQHLDSSEGTLIDLKRALDVVASNYQTYLQRTTQARVAEDLNRASITSLGLAQAATLPFEPARPRVLLILALAIMVGILGGFALVLTLEIFDETLTRPDQIRAAVGLPVLVSLAKV